MKFARNKLHYKFLEIHGKNRQQKKFGTDLDIKLMKESLEDWFIISSLAETLWSGSNTEFGEASVKCLKLFEEPTKQCDGYLELGEHNRCKGICKILFQSVFGFEPKEIRWI